MINAKKRERGQKMTNFDEYVTKLSEQRAKARVKEIDKKLAYRLETRSHEETLAALFSALRFTIGTSDILLETSGAKKRASLFEFA